MTYVRVKDLSVEEQRWRRALDRQYLQNALADPVRRERHRAYKRKHQAEVRDMARLLGVLDTRPYPRCPQGRALAEALRTRAVTLLESGASAETVYPVWAMWKTVERLLWLREGP